jgi:hypothetical protein
MQDSKDLKNGKAGARWLDGALLRLFPDVFFALKQLRLITLNGMKASEEITEEQSRQVHLAFLLFARSCLTEIARATAHV